MIYFLLDKLSIEILKPKMCRQVVTDICVTFNYWNEDPSFWLNLTLKLSRPFVESRLISSDLVLDSCSGFYRMFSNSTRENQILLGKDKVNLQCIEMTVI